MKTYYKKGFTLLEAIIGLGIVVSILTGLLALYAKYVSAFSRTPNAIVAQYLLEEGMEVVRMMRDNSWSNSLAKFSTTTPTRIIFSTTTSAWATTTQNVFVQGLFERTVSVADVRRDDVTKDITTSPSNSTFDSGTRLVTIQVSWQDGPATTTKTLSGYLTNLFSN